MSLATIDIIALSHWKSTYFHLLLGLSFPLCPNTLILGLSFHHSRSTPPPESPLRSRFGVPHSHSANHDQNFGFGDTSSNVSNSPTPFNPLISSSTFIASSDIKLILVRGRQCYSRILRRHQLPPAIVNLASFSSPKLLQPKSQENITFSFSGY